MRGKGFISEGDVALLLRRYTASTLLALLQEIASCGASKLNWDSLAKSSTTGIRNAREYQALWRHLAYRTSIADSFDDETEPLEDDSDLEFEVEPLPGVSPEVAADVAACVKVLAAMGTSGNPASKNPEACFAIDIPNSSSGWEVKGNGQISNVVIQGVTASEMQPVRKKRKLWTPEEDQELIAAVEKCGEGNWATILKGAFKHDRTAAQLSQRWALIRKRREVQTSQSNAIEGQMNVTGNSNGGSQQTVATGVLVPATEGQRTSALTGASTGSALALSNICSTPAAASSGSPFLIPQDQNCTRSVNMSTTASLPPLAGKSRPQIKRAGVSGSQQGRLIGPSAALMGALAAQATSAGGSEIRQAKAVPSASVALPIGSSGSGRYNVSSGMRNSSVSSVGRGSLKTSTGPDPMVQAAAVAAGARIAPASAAASLLKAAQLGNVVHIGPGGVSMGKTGIPSQPGSGTVTSTKSGSGAGSRTSVGTLVHYIRTGTSSPSPSLLLNSQRASQTKNHTIRTSPVQVTHPARSGAANLPTTVNSGPAIVSLTSQMPHPPASTLLSATKSKSKPLPSLLGDSCGNATTDALGKPTATAEGSAVSPPEGIPKTPAQESSSSENLLASVLNDSTNLRFGNLPESKPNGQATGSVSEPSLLVVSDMESNGDVTPVISHIISSSLVKAAAEMAALAVPESFSTSLEADNGGNCASTVATASGISQVDMVE